MHSSVGKPQHTLAQVREMVQRLDDAHAAQEWEAIPDLLQQRNDAAERALTADLPVDLHSDANALLQRLRRQDDELMQAAKKLHEDAGEQMLKLRKQKKSIAAYKE